MVGRTISHYRIESKLGEGGMGVVYKAEDTRLERSVALKFLAPRLLAEPAPRKHFEREAKTVAALDHPNICTLFEIDEAEGQCFLAMAFVDGLTVKEKIAQRPLKLEEALDIAAQTAEGLRAAHQKGIVHRDVKPANIMVNSQGQVKVMDFGLARLTSDTVTQAAAVAGTPAYMSPEQWQGLELDPRTDIWSLGVLLYEMISGQLPFRGQNSEALFHAIRSTAHEPLTSLRGGLPMQVELIVDKCLAKNPAERYQHIDDLIVDLAGLRKKLAGGTIASGALDRRTLAAPASGGASRKRARMALLLAAGAALLALATIGARVFRRAPVTPALRTVKFTITPTQLLRGSIRDIDAEVSISADGTHIAYVESQGGQLWIRDIDQEQARPVPGATGVYQAFWSPDNQFIGYSAGRACGARGGCDLVRIPVQGGTPVPITRLPGAFRRANWSSDGETILYCDTSGMYTIPARGGSPTLILKHPHIEHPSFLDLPGGGRAYLYQTMDPGIAPPPSHEIYVQTARDNRRRLLLVSSSSNPYPAYSPTGHIVYVDGTGDAVAIWALPFSLDTLQATGKPFPIAQHGSSPQVSRTGTLVYSDAPSNRLQLAWCDRSGKVLSTIGDPQPQDGPALSPDGRRLAVNGRGAQPDIWIYDLERGPKTRFTFDPAMEFGAVWSPQGDSITYASAIHGNPHLFSKPFHRIGEAKALTPTPLVEVSPDWSPDGRFLVYAAAPFGGQSQLLYRQRQTDGNLGDAMVFLDAHFNGSDPRFSADGRLLAYVSDQSGRNEVYVRDFPQGTRLWQISANGGVLPRWRRDGRELFYLEQGRLMAVSVKPGQDFEPGTPVPLFTLWTLQSGYDVSHDGRRFVILERPSGEPPLSIHVVHNWFEDFRRQQRPAAR